jgi:Ca2+-binding RTX toxin-like protein
MPANNIDINTHIFDWTELNVPTITNLYLYGTVDTPANYEDRLRSQEELNEAPLEVSVDMVSYMETGPGRYAYAAQAQVVYDLFNGKINLEEGRSYTKGELKNEFGYSNSDFTFEIVHYKLSASQSDYALRTYIYNKSTFKISDDAEFIFENGEFRIDKMAVHDLRDDFDFDSTGLTELGNNLIMQPKIDPYEIGKIVNIKFVNKEQVPKETYTQNHFSKDVRDFQIDAYDSGSLFLTALPAMLGVITGLKISETIKYETDDGGKIIYGSSGANNLEGTSSADIIILGEGDDTILVSEGDDIIDGGVGTDTIDFTPLDSFLNNDVNVNLTTGTATIKYLFDNDTQQITNIENIKTGGGDDNIIGDDLGNNIETGDGENTVSGNGGSDIIKGGSERDILNGNAGVDIIEGGAGNDTIDGGEHGDYLYGDAGVDTIIGGSGADNIYGGSDGDIISGGADGDYIYGEGGADEIDGGSGNDTIYGGLGVDVIEGGIGIDTIYGGDHGDYLYGDSGNDIIRGESGIDHIYGGADDNATDTLSGGADSDTYIFNGNFGSDIIDDSGSGDKIQIDGSILSGSARVIEETDSGAIIYRIGHIIITKPASGSSLFLSSGSNTITINNFDNGDYGFFRKENANSIFRKNENFVEDKISGTDFPRTSELIEKRIEVFLTKNLDSLGLNIDNENLTNQNKRVFYA